jgi:putative acyl-CoA dehydrogenase
MHRVAFQKKLVDHALMTNVLADLALETEAATVLALRLARAYDEDGEAAAVWRRVVTPAAKFWICKRAPALAAEAMEVLGGSGYIEECVLPRIYREAPVNSIWEGSGNVMCLDVLRAIGRTPGTADVLAHELADGAAADARMKAFVVTTRRKRACSRAISRSDCRPRCCSATRRPRSRKRSAPHGLQARAGASSARCRRGSTFA